MNERQFFDLVGRIYEAAADADRWPVFMEEIRRATGAVSSVLMVQDMKNRWGSVASHAGVSAEDLARYSDRFARMNPFFERGAHMMVEGSVLDGREILPLDELQRTEFYNEFLRPQEILHVVGATLFRSQDVSGAFALHRSPKAGAFSDEEVRLVKELVPHLQRAAQLHQRLSTLEAERGALLESLDHIAQGVLLIDDVGRLLVANEEGNRVLGAGDGLGLCRDGELQAADANEGQLLRSMIVQAIDAARGRGVDSGGTLSVSRPSGRRPYVVMVCPYRGNLASAVAPAAVLFVSDPVAAFEAGAQRWGTLFDLTPAEARLAAHLAQGRSISEAAREIGISHHTARSQLKAIFVKTDTHRQAELVSLLHRTALTH